MKTQTNIPDFAQQRIATLRDRATNIKSQLLMSINQLSNTDFSIYKSDHATKLKQDILSKPRKELHKLIKEYLVESDKNKIGIQNRIYAHTKTKMETDPSLQLTNILRQQEIRSLLRSKELPEIKSMLDTELKNNKSELITAIANSPDEILPTKTVNKYREQAAFKKEPELRDYKIQIDSLATVIRSECGLLNSEHTKILMNSKLDDPITMQDHFLTFPPIDDRAKSQANAMINREQNKIRLQQSRETFDKSNNGARL